MAKHKEKQETIEPIKITTWEQWFENCNQLRPKLESYERLVLKYLKLQCSKSEDGRACLESNYLSRHDTGFYENNPLIPMWKFKKILLFLFAGFLTGGVAAFLYRLFSGGLSQQMGEGMLLQVIIGAILGAGIIAGMPAGIHVLRVRKVRKDLHEMEIKLKDAISHIPQKYRNSECCEIFYDLYTSQGITGFTEAIQACDAYLTSNNRPGLYMASMADVPYENRDLAGASKITVRRAGMEDIPEEVLNNPALPADIGTKTYFGVDDAEACMNELVGLSDVKSAFKKMKSRMQFYSGVREKSSGNHMVFLGPPGTGKTTIARILTRLLYDYGYIQNNRCVEIDGGYLKSPYTGQTGDRVEAIVQYAMGGVLFVDEAYVLMDSKGSVTGDGSEAIGVLLKAMEDYRDKLVVIMAGYEDNMNRLLATNEGFQSRIQHKIYFSNFTVDELIAIFRQQMKHSSVAEGVNYKIERGALELLRKHFERESKSPSFGNARAVRNTWDSIMDVHADAFVSGLLSAEKQHVITKQDVETFLANYKEQMRKDGRNFIAQRNLDSTVVSLQELQGKTKKGSENPDAELGRLTGLQVVKDEIEQMKAQFSFYEGNMETEGCHMVFLGPPGTGKTTVASIMTGYLYQMGLIQENAYVDINGDFLRGMYVGHTGKRTEAVVQYSQGMVLFVDEAYLLAGQPGENNSFGQEAIGVLLDAMEKYRQNFVVIFAGYENEMQTFLDMNSGLRSRISLQFHFESYSPKELAQMMQRIAKSQNFKVEKDVWIPLQRWLKIQVQDAHFGNGRFIRQFWENVKKSHIMNYSKKLYTDDKKYVITLQDVEPLLVSKTEN